jgi:hypothetical protein
LELRDSLELDFKIAAAFVEHSALAPEFDPHGAQVGVRLCHRRRFGRGLSSHFSR